MAGLSLAFWLNNSGHDVLVIERFPSLRSTGLQIDIRGHGITVLQKMGLEKTYRAAAAEESGVRMVNSAGRSVAFFKANRTGKGLQDFSTDYEIKRGDLCKLLYDAVRDKTSFKFGVWPERLEQDGKSVRVDFSNGESDTFDLVVGADGVQSRTRRLMGFDGFHPCKGQYIAYFQLPRSALDVERSTVNAYMAPGGRGLMTRGSDPDKVQVYLSCSSDSEKLRKAARNSREEKEIFMGIMRGAGWKTDTILDHINEADDFYCERLGIVDLESWSSGRVTLVGDAGYCPTANTGMGTTSAFVGAYVLAGEISEHEGDVEKALQSYETKFRPFVKSVQAGVLEDGGFKPPQTALGITIMHGLLGLASFFGVNVFGRFFLKENVKGWDLPEYKKMLGS